VIMGIVVSWIPTRAVSLALVFALLGSIIGVWVGTVGTGFTSMGAIARWAAILASVGLPIGGFVGLAMISRGAPRPSSAVLVRTGALIALGGWIISAWVRRTLIEACTLASGSVARYCHVYDITVLLGLDVLMLAALCFATAAIRVPSRGHGQSPQSGESNDRQDLGEATWWLHTHEAPR